MANEFYTFKLVRVTAHYYSGKLIQKGMEITKLYGGIWGFYYAVDGASLSTLPR